jgi:hypothetical protein
LAVLESLAGLPGWLAGSAERLCWLAILEALLVCPAGWLAGRQCFKALAGLTALLAGWLAAMFGRLPGWLVMPGASLVACLAGKPDNLVDLAGWLAGTTAAIGTL